MGESTEKRTIELPPGIISQIENRVKYTEFEDVNTYITHLLKEVLYQIERESDLSGANEIDEQQVEDRLKSLGYLNE